MTQKDSRIAGYAILIVRSVDASGAPSGPSLLAVDVIGAGIGDYVIATAEGGAARQIAGSEKFAPIDVCIAGIIDNFIQ